MYLPYGQCIANYLEVIRKPYKQNTGFSAGSQFGGSPVFIIANSVVFVADKAKTAHEQCGESSFLICSTKKATHHL